MKVRIRYSLVPPLSPTASWPAAVGRRIKDVRGPVPVGVSAVWIAGRDPPGVGIVVAWETVIILWPSVGGGPLVRPNPCAVLALVAGNIDLGLCNRSEEDEENQEGKDDLHGVSLSAWSAFV